MLNPSLRATRDRRGLAQAQLIQAGVLPNPQISFSRDFVTGGNTTDTINAFSYGAGWDLTSLLPLRSKRTAARANVRSVDLDIAWQEWQIAQSARTAVYRVMAREEQVARAREADFALQKNASVLKKAVETHQKTVLVLAAAEATSQDAHAIALNLEQDLEKQRLLLKKVIGLEPHAQLRFLAGIRLPSSLHPPAEAELLAGLEERRLDLLALREASASQDATVRAAVLAQFPKIALGFARINDTSNVHTTGLAITMDFPIFDRNQGVIATERATRQRLLDEYSTRLFEARSDIATALADIASLNRQIAAADEALPLLERLVSTEETAVNEGNADVLGLYFARSNLLQKRIQVLKLKEQLVEARTALEIASGCYLPGAAVRPHFKK